MILKQVMLKSPLFLGVYNIFENNFPRFRFQSEFSLGTCSSGEKKSPPCPDREEKSSNKKISRWNFFSSSCFAFSRFIKNLESSFVCWTFSSVSWFKWKFIFQNSWKNWKREEKNIKLSLLETVWFAYVFPGCACVLSWTNMWKENLVLRGEISKLGFAECRKDGKVMEIGEIMIVLNI